VDVAYLKVLSQHLDLETVQTVVFLIKIRTRDTRIQVQSVVTIGYHPAQSSASSTVQM
jgi:hypothetical protein